MRIAAWTASGYPGSYMTGVGKHARHMLEGLARRKGCDVRLLLARDHVRSAARTRAGSPLARIPYHALPLSRRATEAVWRTVRWPPVETWVADIDWIYCPRELYVPVASARYAVTVHDLYLFEPSCTERRLRHRLLETAVMKPALETAAVVIAVSEFTKGRLIELFGVDPGKIHVVGNGVEEAYFAIADEEPGAVSPYAGKTYVLAVGGLTVKKGGRALLEIATALERVAPHVELIVAGPVETPFQSALQRARNVRSIARGFDDREMQALMRGAAALLAVSEYEGFGIPVIEAMAAGVPVVAALRAALPEVAGDAGVLVDPTRAADIADTLCDIMRDTAARNALIAKGRERARQFTWDRCVDRLAAALTGSRSRSAEMVDRDAA